MSKKVVVSESSPLSVSGRIRLGDDTVALATQLEAGDIAVINHPDLDRAAALALAEARPAAVLNAAPSVTGRYPNRGPHVLLDAGIPLLDSLGTAVLGLKEGQLVSVAENRIYLADQLVAEGEIMTPSRYLELSSEARFGMGEQLESFAANTKEFLRREQDALLEGTGFSQIPLGCKDRISIVVGPGAEAEEQLRRLSTLIREHRPILVGVGSGADTLIRQGHRPSLITGNVKAASDAAVRSGAVIVLRSTFQEHLKDSRLDSIGLNYHTITSGLTDLDTAVMLCVHKGSSLVIPVGDYNSFDEFLDQGRQGMTSSFFTHLVANGTIATPRAAELLYARPMRAAYVWLLMLTALIALGSAWMLTPWGQSIWLLGGEWSWPVGIGIIAVAGVLLIVAMLASLLRRKP
ncbi:putative cytokinetic ring protein SteA [Boudabousia marimammalium]|uniref:Thiamine pyrophosphokinase n=1 Tax=Boudabousia marimammalium TaxID=156892 RepID=A0A1Q5PRG3_9ACTO|nr:putative cytokinetic ring protein SteA [Boudabousia marimammalium]OKL50079.1 hypothetical protein BM477_04135 [Boudabousia marimammalium]